MRILLVSEDIPYPQMGGLAKHVLNLARALKRSGHEVDLLGGNKHPYEVTGQEGHFGGRFFGELDGHDVGWKEKKFGMFVPPRRTWVAKRFAKVILRHASNYDVIHYHGHAANLAYFIPPDINFVQTRHDQGSDCLLDTRFKDDQICASTNATDCAKCRAANPNLVQRTISTAAVNRYRTEVAEGFLRHKTIFVSDMLQRNFCRTMGVEHWGTVVHNFAEREMIDRIRKASRQQPRSEEITIFAAGKLYSAKGFEPFLQELAPRLRANMKVVIAGDGPDAEMLRSRYESDKIQFLGWCAPDQTLEMAAAATVIVVPSIWEEPCSTFILEGLLLAKPTFALARGGTPELTMYAAYPSQLRLHENMQDLVEDLVNFVPMKDAVEVPEDLGSAEYAAKRLLDIYALPPRSALVTQRENYLSQPTFTL